MIHDSAVVKSASLTQRVSTGWSPAEFVVGVVDSSASSSVVEVSIADVVVGTGADVVGDVATVVVADGVGADSGAVSAVQAAAIPATATTATQRSAERDEWPNDIHTIS